MILLNVMYRRKTFLQLVPIYRKEYKKLFIYKDN